VGSYNNEGTLKKLVTKNSPCLLRQNPKYSVFCSQKGDIFTKYTSVMHSRWQFYRPVSRDTYEGRPQNVNSYNLRLKCLTLMYNCLWFGTKPWRYKGLKIDVFFSSSPWVYPTFRLKQEPLSTKVDFQSEF